MSGTNAENLLEYCNPAEVDRMQAIIEHGSLRAAARALGLNYSTIHKLHERVKHRALMAEGGDLRGALPQGHLAEKFSIYFDKEARPTQAWLKGTFSDEDLKAAVRAFMEEVPKLDAPAAPMDFQTDVIPWIQIGDAHIGMLAHAAETGENFDLKIAERELLASIFTLLDELPAS